MPENAKSERWQRRLSGLSLALKQTLGFLFVLAAPLMPAHGVAEPGLQFVSYDWLWERVNTKIEFDDLKHRQKYLPIEGLYEVNGARFGERFAGQFLGRGAPGSNIEDFDVLSGTPSSPLTILPGKPNENITILRSNSRHIGVGLYGESWVGYPQGASGGEGAVSIYFDQDQMGFGFRVQASYGRNFYTMGQVIISCFDTSGAALGTVVFDSFKWDALHSIAVTRTNAAKDIRGCSIENTDPKGVLYDDFIFMAPLRFVS